MLAPITLYLIFGCLAGLLSGLFGIGGGAVLVPFLMWEFSQQHFPSGLPLIMAIATSLATIILTSLASAITHHRLGAVQWPTVIHLTPGILLGSLLGSVVADRLPVLALKSVFALFLLTVSTRMFIAAHTQSAKPWRATRGLLLSAGTLIGALSSLVGIGGGSLTVPFLVKCQVSIRNAVAISSACGFPIATAGALAYWVLGWRIENLPSGSAGYIFVPAALGIVSTSLIFAPIGAKLAHRLPTGRLKKWFALMLFAIGLKLLWQTLPLQSLADWIDEY
jgi:uncharacterized membrane protein YfcA